MPLHYITINKDIVNKSIKLGKKTLHFEAERKLLVDATIHVKYIQKLMIQFYKYKTFNLRNCRSITFVVVE